jgi:hypothetical protein
VYKEGSKHICVGAVAGKIYKELLPQLKTNRSGLSPEKAKNIARTIYAVKVKHPLTGEVTDTTVINSRELQGLAKLFNF